MTMTTATEVALIQDVGMGSDDPAPKPTRRRFGEKYKADIVAEYDRATERGAKGEILRREGLFSNQVLEWRQALDASGRGVPTPKKRSQLEAEVKRLRSKTERLEDQLKKHKQVLEIQGKASELLARLLAESDDNPETKQQP
jgi:transposase-like protein